MLIDDTEYRQLLFIINCINNKIKKLNIINLNLFQMPLCHIYSNSDKKMFNQNKINRLKNARL